MWKYEQESGALSENGQHAAHGYSGHNEGRNNPELQTVRAVGPIPQGQWLIVGPPFDSPEHGKYVLRLAPKPGTDTFGRDGFLMHGDSIEHPGLASKGCICMPRAVRESVWLSGDRELTVTA